MVFTLVAYSMIRLNEVKTFVIIEHGVVMLFFCDCKDTKKADNKSVKVTRILN
jgi:hypothetical protein